MEKHIQLNIPEPCHESWDKMTPVEKGRFCGSCQKPVIDFTAMSDVQLVAFFKKPPTGSVCGRFMNDQIERNITIPKKRVPWVKYFFQFAIPAILFSFKATAQGKVKVMTSDTIEHTNSQTIRGKVAVAPISEQIIKGRILDNNGVGIASAIITVKSTRIATVTDASGNYTLNYKGSATTIVLTVSAIGFTEKQRSVILKKKKVETVVVQFKLEPKSPVGEEAFRVGMVVVEN